MSSGLILYDEFLGVLPPAAGGEKELGASIPTVFKRNISNVINVARIWRGYDYGILHRGIKY